MAYRWTVYTRIKCSECKLTREALASKVTTAILMGLPPVCRFCAPVGRMPGEDRSFRARKANRKLAKEQGWI